MKLSHEVNFDGIVGPTHNYAGLSYGNVASMTHKRSVSSPRQAALQGLAKMKFLADLGVRQAVLPPHERPHLPTLRRVGFTGSDADILAKVQREDPVLLAAVSSASSMWAANAATVSPSADAADGRVHFTPANLISNLHRSIEAETTARILRAIFADERHFAHHDPLPATASFADEGAANHTRLFSDAKVGVEIFIYGSHDSSGPTKFPARQSFAASSAIARLHGPDPARTLFIHQNPAAIDAGAFHNDVVAVGHRNVLLYHEGAWVDAAKQIESLRALVPDLEAIEVTDAQVPLADAISSYLFNSQLATLADGSLTLIAPLESRDNPRAFAFLRSIPMIKQVHFVDVRQSMHNGGGPACLRLRVVLTESELATAHPGVFLTESLHARLKTWIETHYRDELRSEDLADPKLLEESRRALDELTQILCLPSLYEFQKS